MRQNAQIAAERCRFEGYNAGFRPRWNPPRPLRQGDRKREASEVQIKAPIARVRGTFRLALWALAAATFLAGLPDPVLAQGTVKSVHGDWEIRCDTPPGSSGEQCALMQFVLAEDRDNVGLTVIIVKTADKKARILRVLAPLGVLLPNGLGLNVDGKDIGRAYFVRCFQDGCYAEVILEKQLLDTLKTGQSATFIVFQTPEEGIGIPISLNGFQPGYAALP
jgi:invasion protein IalB